MKKFPLLYWATALALGLLAGLVDLQAREVQVPALLVLVFAGLLGYMQPRRAWLWAMTVGSSILLVHLLASLFGYPSRYPIEPNVFASLIALIPAFIGAYLGVLIGYLTSHPRRA